VLAFFLRGDNAGVPGSLFVKQRTSEKLFPFSLSCNLAISPISFVELHSAREGGLTHVPSPQDIE